MDTEGLQVEKINQWKTGMKEKGLRVNMGKTKVVRCKNRVAQVENMGTFARGGVLSGVLHAT